MKRGPKPKGKVKIIWSSNFAYAIGLITADGCLSKDGRHIDLTSKDKEQIVTFNKCLDIDSKVSAKSAGNGNMAFHSQFGDVLFYRFLVSIGLTPAKSKTISSVLLPDRYFIDFLRGYFDGDGTSCSFQDPVFKQSFRFYVSFITASPLFFVWLRKRIKDSLGIVGHFSYNKNNTYVQLRYSKKEAIVLCHAMYYAEAVPCLKRKRLKVEIALSKIQ